MITIILTVFFCSVLLFGAIVLLIMNQFKDDKPSWERFLKGNKKHWRKLNN